MKLILPSILAAALAAEAHAQASSDATPDGKALFVEKCAMCHRERGMGTGLLARRMNPSIAELENRTDLQPAYVVRAARGGIGNMPRISRAEVSDPQLSAIAAYLAKTAKAAP